MQNQVTEVKERFTDYVQSESGFVGTSHHHGPSDIHAGRLPGCFAAAFCPLHFAFLPENWSKGLKVEIRWTVFCLN